MNDLRKHLSTYLIGIAALLVGAAPAWAQTAPSLGTASSFAVLSVGTEIPPRTTVADPTAAVTLSYSAVIGNVGSAGAITLTGSTINGKLFYSGALTNTGSTISGMSTTPLPAQVETDFDTAYAALALTQCDQVLTTLPTTPLSPGVYCFASFVASTGGVLTLDGQGDPNAVWIFKIGTSGAGYLEGTNFTVNLVNGATACNVYWWIAQYATLTDSDFKGTILAGAAISTTRGTFEGRALAKAEVTLTGTAFIGCEGAISGGGKSQSKCNQGVGNGPELCDPGNSNQDRGLNPFFPSPRSNDELPGAIPGNPGRKNGNK